MVSSHASGRRFICFLLYSLFGRDFRVGLHADKDLDGILIPLKSISINECHESKQFLCKSKRTGPLLPPTIRQLRIRPSRVLERVVWLSWNHEYKDQMHEYIES